MARDKFDWMMTDVEGNVLVARGYYTWDDVDRFKREYMAKGYVVNSQVASVPNMMIMETADADDKRKEALMVYVTTLPIREQALLLAWLSERVTQVGLATIWNYAALRKVHDDLQNIRTGVWDLKDDMIVALRAAIA